ncbi:MAG TPA: hypothetical protein DD001_22035 [Microcoleaceae bacterium UBA10368]|jgi:hypothetical protein|nr:hypothetical protein [Microcoleaceae cyanobacterium UBA10368]HCV31307.1 hypothetical protein [Microcoleaceae cyanobacterium UBA9251]
MKGRSIFGLIISLAITSQSVFTQSIAVESKRDSVTPSQQEASAILQAICGRDDVFPNRDRGGKLACRKCPSFTGVGSNRGSFTGVGSNRGSLSLFTLEKVVYGSFTQAGTREALADFDGCESHGQFYGGSVLLRRSSQGWSALRYESGLRSNNCLKFPSKNGRDLLVCQGYYAQMGHSYDWLDAIQIGSSETKKSQPIDPVSNTANYKPPFYETRIEDWIAQDIDKDGRPDLSIRVREAKSATKPPGFETRYDSHLPNPTFHRLTFLFDGQSFRATPDTAQLKQRIERK